MVPTQDNAYWIIELQGHLGFVPLMHDQLLLGIIMCLGVRVKVKDAHLYYLEMILDFLIS